MIGALHQVPAVGRVGHVPVAPAVEIFGLVGVQIDVHAAQQIDDLLELIEVHLHVAVHLNAEILQQRGVQQLHAAQGVGGVDAVILIVGNFHIQVPHEGGHGQGFALGVEGTQDHAVGPGAALTFPAVLADEQQVDDAVAADVGQITVVPGDIGGVPGFQIAPGFRGIFNFIDFVRRKGGLAAVDPPDLAEQALHRAGCNHQHQQHHGQKAAQHNQGGPFSAERGICGR